MQLGFELYDTGEYSITRLRDTLEELGLTCRPTRTRVAKPLSRPGVHKMLRNPYYVGVVVFMGQKTKGRPSQAAIERKYKTLVLKPVEQQAIRSALLDRVSVKTEAARKESGRHERRLRELLDQQQKLVHLYYTGDVSQEVLKAEQERIEAERAQAEQWAAAAKQEVEDVDRTLSDALVLIDADTVPYLTAAPFERRLINLAIYVMLLIHSLKQIDAKITALYAQLVPLARRLAQAARSRQNGPQA